MCGNLSTIICFFSPYSMWYPEICARGVVCNLVDQQCTGYFYYFKAREMNRINVTIQEVNRVDFIIYITGRK